MKAWLGLAVVCLMFLLTGTVFAADGAVNKIAAVVNGEIITLHSLRTNTMAELARQNIPQKDPRVSPLMRNILDSMINDILLRQEATRYKLSVSDSDIEGELRSIMRANNLTQEAFEANLAKQGASLTQLRERVKDSLLRNRILSVMIARKVLVTKDEIAEFYEAHREQFSGQKYAEFSVIVFPPHVRAQKIYEQIKSGALAFDAAARQYSLEGSGKNGGYVGRIPWNALPEPVRNAFSALPRGGLTPLVSMEGRTLLFSLKSVGEGKPQTLAQASEQIEAFLRQPRLEERFKEYTQQLRGKAVVDIRL